MSTIPDTERPRRLLTVTEVGERLAISRATVYRLMDKKELAYHRIGGSRRVSQEVLDSFLRRTKTFQD